jgi:hypothetical protein
VSPAGARTAAAREEAARGAPARAAAVVVGDVDLAGGPRVVARVRGVVQGDAGQRLRAVGAQVLVLRRRDGVHGLALRRHDGQEAAEEWDGGGVVLLCRTGDSRRVRRVRLHPHGLCCWRWSNMEYSCVKGMAAELDSETSQSRKRSSICRRRWMDPSASAGDRCVSSAAHVRSVRAGFFLSPPPRHACAYIRSTQTRTDACSRLVQKKNACSRY